MTPIELEEKLLELPNRIAKAAVKVREAFENCETTKLQREKEEAILYLKEKNIASGTVQDIKARIASSPDYWVAASNEIKKEGELKQAQLELEKEQNNYISIRKIVSLKEIEYKLTGDQP